MENGNFPEGLASPQMILAVAVPAWEPKYHDCMSPSICESHGMLTALPLISMTPVLGFT
jgi:hypothetical protein